MRVEFLTVRHYIECDNGYEETLRTVLPVVGLVHFPSLPISAVRPSQNK